MTSPGLIEFKYQVGARTGIDQPLVEEWSAITSTGGKLDGLCHFGSPLAIEDGSFFEVLWKGWDQLKPGGWLAVSTLDSVHESVALATVVGWLLEDHFEPRSPAGHRVLVLKRGRERNGMAQGVDWPAERSRWKALGGEIGGVPTRPRMRRPGRQRQCHVYGISIAKSGSRSIAGLFSTFHSAHEFDAAQAIEWLTSGPGRRTSIEIADWLRDRDLRSGHLECDSSQLHHWYLESLVAGFPDARFLLTVREPRAWLRSFVNHRLSRGLSPEWEPLERLRFGSHPEPPHEAESLLAAFGMPPLCHLLKFWAEHHRKALQVVPQDRLMVVKLEDLKRCVPMVARFAGLNPGTLNPLKARLNEGQADFHLIERLSQDHLEKVIGEECGTVWNALLERCMQPHAAISED